MRSAIRIEGALATMSTKHAAIAAATANDPNAAPHVTEQPAPVSIGEARAGAGAKDHDANACRPPRQRRVDESGAVQESEPIIAPNSRPPGR